MTKLSNNNRHSTVVITVIIILAAAIATILVFRALYNNHATQPQTDDITPTTSSTTTAPNPAVTDTEAADVTDTTDTADATDTTAQSTDDSHLGTPTQYEGQDPNNSSNIEASLTYYGIQDDAYLVNINIAQYLSGTCSLTLGDYSASVAIDQSAASSACSFRIPPAQLTAGLQKLKINIKSNTISGTIEETIDVNL